MLLAIILSQHGADLFTILSI